jgi:isocitrate dehydrogenase
MKSINEYTVGELMSRSLVVIKESTPLTDAITKMLAAKVSALIVEKSHDHDVYGILTRKDIVVEAAEGGADGFASLTVHDLATKPAVDIQASASVKHAVRLMRLVGVRRVLVMEGDKPAGILSNTDIFKRIALDVSAGPAKK